MLTLASLEDRYTLSVLSAPQHNKLAKSTSGSPTRACASGQATQPTTKAATTTRSRESWAARFIAIGSVPAGSVWSSDGGSPRPERLRPPPRIPVTRLKLFVLYHPFSSLLRSGLFTPFASTFALCI
ncbi:hypothetical protein BOTBODRAFT_567139 [Botryobasidium botryosum FD-172 SS1]|uniref:Uncharacterized protein n=1 Tax=Botryobasidium botryosum (strain FD-172 SS1) TaxID=930990 RepID=A0A067M1C5_BOTB1|nr:hypothetical protein BOTBODRAFT_567139 [Botryobasidium botryosum FD-172 SS1]